MDPRAVEWAASRTWSADDFDLQALIEARGETRISVVIPARNEEATVAAVVAGVRADLVEPGLVDELVVMDSLSQDGTAHAARAAGARVVDVADVLPELGVVPGKGEALWKSQFVTDGDLLVFVDADLTHWGTHFVIGLVGPLLEEDDVQLVRGYYDRILSEGEVSSLEGGRVTEILARPWLAAYRPELSAVVQPLAGEWAIRRSWLARLEVPVGYGVEIATLLDTASMGGLSAVAQVDLGRRAHRHQNLHDLGAMATELLAVMDRRRGLEVPDLVALPRIVDGDWRDALVPTLERPAGRTLPGPPGGC